MVVQSDYSISLDIFVLEAISLCSNSYISLYIDYAESLSLMNKDMTNESMDEHECTNNKEFNLNKHKLREFICGEEALKISPTEPYCLHRPVRRGHLNVSQHYPLQQVLSLCFVLSCLRI